MPSSVPMTAPAPGRTRRNTAKSGRMDIDSVAALARVSAATVSRAINQVPTALAESTRNSEQALKQQ
ncbi:MAG: hypothetical protein WBG54_14585 [Acidobacteriaceae bacterium]